MSKSLNKFILLLITLFILVLAYIIYIVLLKKKNLLSSLSENDISLLTDNWCNSVIIKHDPEAIANLFCPDGNLVGTVSQVKRKGLDIKRYFNYFAKLPNINIIDKKYNISKVTNDVFINTAFITWMWDGLEKPIVARMTFVFRNSCIFQLHSSALPDLNDKLLEVSNVA